MAISRFRTSTIAQGLPKFQDIWDGVSSTSAPLPLAGYMAWYDASHTAGITSSGGAVSQMIDRSLNNFHLTQSNAAGRPGTGAATLAGRNVLTFNNHNLFNSSLDLGTSFTLCYVFRYETSATGAMAWYGTDSTNAGYISGIHRNTSVGSEGGSTYGQTSVSSSPNTWYRVAHTSDNITNRTILNNTTTSSTSYGSGMNPSPSITLGSYWGMASYGSFPFIGKFAELIVYPYVLNSAQLTEVDNYFKAKWGL